MYSGLSGQSEFEPYRTGPGSITNNPRIKLAQFGGNLVSLSHVRCALAELDYLNTMKFPYAKKWQKETDELRKIALDCDLT